jgi:type I restriction enzyme S subunit
MMAAFVSGATNQIELNADRLGTAPVPLPPMEEQLRIANFLDVETARLDKMYSMQRRVMDLTDEREAAFMQEMLIDRQDCKFVPLWSLTDAARPVMYGIVLPGPNVDDGVPIVKGGDIGSGRLRVGSLNRTTREIESRYARSRLRGGDLVMAIRGSVGEVGVIPPELSGANLTQDAARIAPSLSVVPRWLQLILATPLVIGEINARVTGATVKGINIWDLKRVSIPAPSVELQQRIVGEVDGELERHARLRVAIKKQLKLLEERRRALITAAVTGQFDVSTAGAGRYG